MSVRVVARIRPLLEHELDKDTIVRPDRTEDGNPLTVVKIPNPKNEAEEFSFAFNGVYDQSTTQEELFNGEVAPHLKSLFQGLDVTIFAYGATGTGKTHSMRGGLRLAERGVIPRLLSGIFRRGRKINKDSGGATSVEVTLSYYEIYNDKVFDLLESPEKRTPAGLPLREKDGRTVVVGLSERACGDLKDFERLYIESNNNRVTAATKLNAQSSRSHAILRVTVTQTTGDRVLSSTASAIDLAGSEDNRRTDNGKERLVESAAINKSLFVLSQCIDAISRGDKRIPYRESKMTRILSLGQNNGITVMILNLAPMRSYHLDTLSSLTVSSRAKRIEVREIENEVVFKQVPKTSTSVLGGRGNGSALQRQPLRPLANAHNVTVGAAAAAKAKTDRPVKAFSVYLDRSKSSSLAKTAEELQRPRSSGANKRSSDSVEGKARPAKVVRLAHTVLSRAPQAAPTPSISAAQIEEMVERKVQEILASRAAQQQEPQPAVTSAPSLVPQQATGDISAEVQRRLEALERRIDDDRHDDARSEGLRFLLQARHAKERGEDETALRYYRAALPFFPGQAKLLSKIEKLAAKIGGGQKGISQPMELVATEVGSDRLGAAAKPAPLRNRASAGDNANEDYRDGGEADVDDESFVDKPQRRKAARKPSKASKPVVAVEDEREGPVTPRAKQLLEIINSRDLALIRTLHGFGAKKAQDLVEHLSQSAGNGLAEIASLTQLRMVPGMGGRAIERAYEGLVAG